MRAWTVASRRLRPARFVKYEMVMGTIGKTHGVSSDNAPINAASPMYAPSVLAFDAAARSGTRATAVVDAVAAAVAGLVGTAEPEEPVEPAEPEEPEEPAEPVGLAELVGLSTGPASLPTP